MKKIVVLSRQEVEHIVSTGAFPEYAKEHIQGNWVLISIYGEYPVLHTFAQLDTLKSAGCVQYIDCHFADITEQIDEFVLFNKIHARKIIDFIDKMKDEVDTLVVHCAAGISRSGAVGLFVCRYLGLDETEFRKINSNIAPNMHVLKVLNTVSGIDDRYVDFWKNQEVPNRLRSIMDYQARTYYGS